MKLQDGEESHGVALLSSEQVSDGGRGRGQDARPQGLLGKLFSQRQLCIAERGFVLPSLFSFPSGEFAREHCPCTGLLSRGSSQLQ